MWPGIVLALLCLAAALPRLWEITTSSGEWLAVGPVPTAMFIAQAAIALRASLGRIASAFVAGACGVLLFVKPLVEPVMHDTGPFSFTSETHLYYVVPGLLLALLALFLGLVAGRGSDRMRTLLVAITSATAAFVMLGTFFVGRPSEMEIVTLLVPGPRQRCSRSSSSHVFRSSSKRRSENCRWPPSPRTSLRVPTRPIPIFAAWCARWPMRLR
jgi:hypothetical protein